MGIFDLLSLLYVFLGLRAIVTAMRNWRAFTDDALTDFDRHLARELAFFIFIPIGVFLHELGHALATIQVGGRVAQFHYAFFYGYVVPRGNFSDLQTWWIALSGNLVSIAFGFLPLILLLLARKVWIQYLLLAFARIQLGWSLVGYPLLTLAGFQGDWIAIYTALPLFITAPFFVTHAALIAALWIVDRSPFVRRFELRLYAGIAEQLRARDAAILARRGAPDPLIERGNFFAEQGQLELAVADYRAALGLDAQNPRALYDLGQLRLAQKKIGAAEKYFRAALPRAAAEARLAGAVHYGLALCLYHRGKAREAIVEFDDAIARADPSAEIYFWRGLTHRQLRNDAAARQDLQRVMELAVATNPELALKARQMLDA